MTISSPYSNAVAQTIVHIKLIIKITYFFIVLIFLFLIVSGNPIAKIVQWRAFLQASANETLFIGG